MTTSWSVEGKAALADLIGLPWEPGARGPYAFDCYGMVRHIQKRFYGIDLPDLVVNSDNDAEISDKIFQLGHPLGEEISGPSDGCVVTMGNERREMHLGVYVAVDGGRIIHSERGTGCVAVPIAQCVWRKLRFYRVKA